ncbi:MAG: Fic family protein, partial [Desulfobacteraceae bacterium]|nr:Fic family protein [Desulfobacteraceae bacterium]
MKPKDADYRPPYTITPAILNLVARISETIGRLSILTDQAKALRLRRISRIRTIQGSLAIEGNTLSEAQITAILDGKRVIAPPREVLEVRNALAAYDRFDTWRPNVQKDLLAAHRVLMSGLIDEAGIYRRGGVGVMAGRRVIHMAPPADRVPQLMRNLLRWLAAGDAHPLIASSVFHYEFEFIHPFADGNGRIGRLWQSLILSRWNPLLGHIPVESLIFEHQPDYYQALRESTLQTDSAPFITFMLRMILAAVTHAAPQVTPQVTPQVGELLLAIAGEMRREALQAALGLQDRKSF